MVSKPPTHSCHTVSLKIEDDHLCNKLLCENILNILFYFVIF